MINNSTMYIKNLIVKLNIYLIKFVHWLPVVMFFVIFFALNIPTVYCSSSNWDEQWIQGVPLSKQPDWFKHTPNEDPRSLYEQMNGPIWRSIYDHYDMDHDNPQYQKYGWNDDTASSSSDSDTSSYSSQNTSFSDSEDEFPKNVQNVDEARKTASIKKALTFCSEIEPLSYKEKTARISEYMFKEIVNHLVEISDSIKDQQINIRFIVQETIHNPILIKLWSVSEGSHDVLQNPMANDIMNVFSFNIQQQDTNPNAKIILKHMMVQIAATNSAISENMPLDNLFDNDTTYDILCMQVHNRINT